MYCDDLFYLIYETCCIFVFAFMLERATLATDFLRIFSLSHLIVFFLFQYFERFYCPLLDSTLNYIDGFDTFSIAFICDLTLTLDTGPVFV